MEGRYGQSSVEVNSILCKFIVSFVLSHAGIKLAIISDNPGINVECAALAGAYKRRKKIGSNLFTSPLYSFLLNMAEHKDI
jgi:hypothetical protein